MAASFCKQVVCELKLRFYEPRNERVAGYLNNIQSRRKVLYGYPADGLRITNCFLQPAISTVNRYHQCVCWF